MINEELSVLINCFLELGEFFSLLANFDSDTVANTLKLAPIKPIMIETNKIMLSNAFPIPFK